MAYMCKHCNTITQGKEDKCCSMMEKLETAVIHYIDPKGTGKAVTNQLVTVGNRAERKVENQVHNLCCSTEAVEEALKFTRIRGMVTCPTCSKYIEDNPLLSKEESQ